MCVEREGEVGERGNSVMLVGTPFSCSIILPMKNGKSEGCLKTCLEGLQGRV